MLGGSFAKLAVGRRTSRAVEQLIYARITEFAATLPRSGDVAERLIRYGEEREQRRRERIIDFKRNKWSR